jgi:hypothetical protein
MKTRLKLTRRFATSAVVLGFVSTLASSAEPVELTRADLTARVVGNTIHYQAENEDIYEYLAPDGLIRGWSSVQGAYTAHWRFLDNDAICFEHADPMASGCVAVVLREGSIEYHRRDGVVEGPFPLLRGNPRGL